jgi:enamidase
MSLNGAKILGIDGDVGTVESGKVADLVVIEGDVEAKGHMRDVALVYRHGVGYDSPAIMERLRGVVGIR